MKPFSPQIFWLVVFSLFAGLGPASTAFAEQARHRRLDARLSAVVEEQVQKPQRVIIRVQAGARPAVRRALSEHGDQILTEHESLDAITANVHAADLPALAAQSFVLSVSSDAVVRSDGLLGGVLGVVGGLVGGVVKVLGSVVGAVLLPSGADTSGPAVPPAVLRATLGLGSTWTGNGVGVAVIDSGLEDSSEFRYRVKAFYDFTKGGIPAPSTAYDDNGHGTHIAGTIAGSGAKSDSAEYRGLAPKVELIIFKVLDKDGAGWTSDVIRAIDFAVANRTALGIHVINLSLGHPILEPAATDPLVQAVERAVRAGVIVVTAAGNYGKNPETGVPGYGGITSPGNAPSAITVGALRTEDTVSRVDDRIADYSSAGPTWYDGIVKPDVVAPGHNIVAVAAKGGTLYQTYPTLKAADSDYFRLSGTSMAAAVATGAIAHILEANRYENPYPHPRLSASAVKAILQYTAFGVSDSAGAEYPALRKGAGALNAKGAISLARTIDTSAAVGADWLSASPWPWTRIGSDDLAWSQSVTWGTHIIWGTSIAENEVAWGSHIIWGTDVAWGSHIIWGTNLVWTESQAWANSIVWGTQTIGRSDDEHIIWGTADGLTPGNVAWGTLAATGSTATVNAK